MSPNVTGLVAALVACAGSLACTMAETQAEATEVAFYGNPNSPIASRVLIPPDRASVWISGTVPPVIDTNAAVGSPRRYGDTATQARGILHNIANQLATHGLSMKDVVYVRAYLVADPSTDGRIDAAGWNQAYREVFGTPEIPTKTARSTVGVAALVNPDWLIEIEAFAVYP